MLWLSKHARLRNNLSPYIDGRLTASQATALKAHLAVCETCSRELDELRATATALNELPQASARPGPGRDPPPRLAWECVLPARLWQWCWLSSSSAISRSVGAEAHRGKPGASLPRSRG